MKVHKENMERVTKMVAEEVQTLKTQCDRERESAKLLKMEAERVRYYDLKFNFNIILNIHNLIIISLKNYSYYLDYRLE